MRAPAASGAVPESDVQFIFDIVAGSSSACRRGRRSGGCWRRQRSTELGGEDVEIGQVGAPIVIEVAALEVRGLVTEVRGEQVEVREVHLPVAGRVAVE